VTLLVEAPPGYEPERRYILDVVLADWLGLEWELRAAERSVEWYELLNPDYQPDSLFRAWDEIECIQPLHRYIEEVLVEADWGEVIVAINLVLAGLLEPFLRELYIKGGRAQGDFTTAALGTHLAKDATRQVAWTDAFLAQCAADDANAKVISAWVDRYLPLAAAAIDAVVEAYPLDGIGPRAAAVARTECRARLEKVNVTLTDHVAAALAVEGDLS